MPYFDFMRSKYTFVEEEGTQVATCTFSRSFQRETNRALRRPNNEGGHHFVELFFSGLQLISPVEYS